MCINMNKRTIGANWRVPYTFLISVIAMAVNYLIMFLLTPYITTYLGTEAYGFVSLAKTVSNYGIIITGCLNTYAARYITIEYHKGDFKKANSYFSSVVFANLGMLAIVVVFAFLFITKLQLFIRIPNDLVHDVKILFSLDILNYMLVAFANTFTASAYINNRLDKLEIIKLITYVSEAVVLVLLFYFLPPKVYYVGIGLLFSTTVLGILNYILCKKETPELAVSYRSYSWSAVKDLVLSGIWNSINSVGNLLNSGLDLWVSNLMLSAISMGQLSIVKTVSTILSTIEQLISRPFQPYLLKHYSEKNTKGLINIFKLEIKVSGFVCNMVATALICFGTAYYTLWTPGQDINLLYSITVVTVIGFMIEGMIQPLFYTYTLTLKNKIPCYVTILSGLFNVLGMYILLKFTDLGLYAVVGTTTVLGFINYLFFTPLYTAHCLNVKWYTFYPEIIRVICSEIPILLISGFLFRNSVPESWLKLAVFIIAMCVVAAPIYLVCVFNIKEMKLVVNRMRKK